MHRLARHLFTLCSAVSLLLCIAACVLWVRSYGTGESVTRAGPGRNMAINSLAGRVGAQRWAGVGSEHFVLNVPGGATYSPNPVTLSLVAASGEPPVFGYLRSSGPRVARPATQRARMAPTPRTVVEPDWVSWGYSRRAGDPLVLRRHWLNHLGLGGGVADSADWPLKIEVRWFSVPYWLVVAITAVLPVARFRRTVAARRRRKAGLCPSCGYDLRATPGRCPECGALAAAANSEAPAAPPG